MSECKTCDSSGWIQHQHPAKPAGVVISVTPCPECNADSSKQFLTSDAKIQFYPCPDCKAKDTEIARLRRRDSEAAEYVESPICMRTGFTGDPPYVGWRGLGLALTEALDERDALRAESERLRECWDGVLGVATLLRFQSLEDGDEYEQAARKLEGVMFAAHYPDDKTDA